MVAIFIGPDVPLIMNCPIASDVGAFGHPWGFTAPTGVWGGCLIFNDEPRWILGGGPVAKFDI